jgi:hypothetical protein
MGQGLPQSQLQSLMTDGGNVVHPARLLLLSQVKNYVQLSSLS